MSTFISGVASCAAIDTSGELVDIKGLDISSLPKSGIINFEHDIAKGPKGEKLIIHIPAQIVGKIIKAKKIFSTSDCSNENELYFWNKTQLPMVYIVAELLDDYCDSAREVAGKFKYSKAHPEQHAIFGFSVEGGELPGTRQGIVITRSIGRKVTVTQAPANHMCLAEIYEAQEPSQVKDDFESLFKTEAHAIEMFKSETGHKVYEQFLAKKEIDLAKIKDISQEYENKGIRPGTNVSGQHAFSHGSVRPYKFNPAEHQETGEHHKRAVVTAKNPKLADNQPARRSMHAIAAASGGREENRPDVSLNDKNKMAEAVAKQPPLEVAKSEDSLHGIPRGWTPRTSKLPKIGTVLSMHHPEHGTVTVHKNPSTSQFEVNHAGKTAGIKGKKGVFGTNVEAISHAQKYVHALHGGKVLGRTTANMPSDPKKQIAKSEELQLNKALEAGSYNAAPSALAGGAVYQTEGLSGKQATTGAEDHNFQGTKKKTDWNKRAKEEYERWPHREKFEKFMAQRLPHLHKGEIAAIGRTVALGKSLDFEKALKSLYKK